MSIFGKPLITGVGKGHASGAIASFTDGAKDLPLKSLLVNIDPVQDLHGYDNPWPAGGGKNKCDYDTIYSAFKVADNSFSGSSYDIAQLAISIPSSLVGQQLTWSAYIDLTGVTTPTSYTAKATVDGVQILGNAVRYGESGYTEVTFTPVSTNDKVQFTWGSGIGTIAVKDFQLEIGSSRTTWNPYSNICPISGWSAVNLWRTGVNVWDEEWERGYYLDNGTPVADSNRIRCKNRISVKPSTMYYMYAGGSANYELYVIQYDSTGAYLQKQLIRNTTFNTNAKAQSILIYVVGIAAYSHDISINYPSTDHDYHPYSGNQYTIQLGQTVYCGTLDVTNGVLTVTHKEVALGSLPGWTKSTLTAGTIFRTTISDKADGQHTLLCSDYAYASNGGFGTSANSIGDSNASAYVKTVFVNDPAMANLTTVEFMSAVSGVQLVYELTTPITISLTPTEISTLQRQNNVWADSGDVDVEYLKQTLMYVGSSVLI